MKKTSILSLVIFLFFILSASAQLKIGAKMGYSIGNLSDSSDNIYTKDFKSISGVDFGLTVEIPVNELFSVQPELNYTHRGGERNGMQPVPLAPLAGSLAEYGMNIEQLNNMIIAGGGIPLTDANPLYAAYNNHTELNYIEIPVLAKFGWGSDWRFFAEAGPFIGFLINSTQTTSGTSKFYMDEGGNMALQIPNPQYDPENPETGPPYLDFPSQNFKAETDTKEELNTVNAGLQGGLGVIKKIDDKNEVYLDLRGTYGFIPIQKDDTFGESKVGGIIISLGYAFSL